MGGLLPVFKLRGLEVVEEEEEAVVGCGDEIDIGTAAPAPARPLFGGVAAAAATAAADIRRLVTGLSCIASKLADVMIGPLMVLIELDEGIGTPGLYFSKHLTHDRCPLIFTLEHASQNTRPQNLQWCFLLTTTAGA